MPRTSAAIVGLMASHGSVYTWALLRAMETEDQAHQRARVGRVLALLACGAEAGASPDRCEAVVLEHVAAVNAAIAEDLSRMAPGVRRHGDCEGGGIGESC